MYLLARSPLRLRKSSLIQDKASNRGYHAGGVSDHQEGHAMRDDPTVIALVGRVCDGDQKAWNDIIDRYSPLVWSICLRYQLSRQDIDDVGQSIWLLLVENIGSLREPAALPGWIATATRHECLRIVRTSRRQDPGGLPPEDLMPPDQSDTRIEQELFEAERYIALRAAFAELPSGCHALLSMLIADPPPGYAQISQALGIPIGSIGPTRARCLQRLRRSPHLAAFLDEAEQTIAVQETAR
jgi:RNA polymerase sigma factor (sigma-70 family)